MLKCDVCGADGVPKGYAGLLKCPACTHVWADLSLGADELTRLYQRQYFFGEEYGDYLRDRRILEKNFAARLATLRRFMTAAHRHLFEVGAAYGFFLNLARPLFQSVRGIDVSEDAVNHARTELHLDVTCGDLLNAELDGPVDVACMWDTIEHLETPRRYVERLAAKMKPGALIAVTTGDISSLNARMQKARWRLIHPPTHVHYFSRRSLETLLDRAGFRVVHVEHCGFHRSVSGMLHNLVSLRWGSRRIDAFLQRITPARLDVYANLYDIMYIVAERR
ncbi:MAG TPA: class I SAM-dependent methyltransferase [Vicinamibacterales bacterium]|nr:class I SAM-dependent methyltransferase [Vicinamibacterales bacterium]